jgi:hypothetical protein
MTKAFVSSSHLYVEPPAGVNEDFRRAGRLPAMPVRWPSKSPRRTKARLKWFNRFRRLRAGHSLKDLARRWNETYDVVRHWAKFFAYQKAPYQQGLPRETWAGVEWDQPLKDIARQLGVSEPTVSHRRKALGMPPLRTVSEPNRSPSFAAFKRWVRKYGRLLHRLPASQILRLAGVEKDVHPFSAAYPLRGAGVLPHDPGWLWRHLDYRLPTTVLANVWRVNKASVVKARRRLNAPRPLWRAKRENSHDRAYNAALARETRKARRLLEWQRRRAQRLKKMPPAV